MPSAVPDMEHLNFFLILYNAMYYTIDMRFMAVEQMPQLFTPADQRTSVRQFFQAENGLFESPIPFEGRIGMFGVDFPI